VGKGINSCFQKKPETAEFPSGKKGAWPYLTPHTKTSVRCIMQANTRARKLLPKNLRECLCCLQLGTNPKERGKGMLGFMEIKYPL
jgi:hypothetical protein